MLYSCRFLLCILATLATMLQVVTGVRCYECSSSWSYECNMSPPPSRYLKQCSVPMCSKFYAEENGQVRVERFCGGSDFSSGCRDASFPDRGPGSNYYRALSCQCNDKDGCNGAFSFIPKVTFISAIVIFPYIFTL